MAPKVRTGGSAITGQAAPPPRNIHFNDKSSILDGITAKETNGSIDYIILAIPMEKKNWEIVKKAMCDIYGNPYYYKGDEYRLIWGGTDFMENHSADMADDFTATDFSLTFYPR